MSKQIKRQIVPDQYKFSFGTGNPCLFITIHQTGNTDYGAGAQNHADYQSGMNVGYGWHYQVDDTDIIQSYEDTFKVWNAGDGTGQGNTASISIEMCVNVDSDYKKAFANLVWLVAHLMNKHDIPLKRVVQHNYWNEKNCPMEIRQGKFGLTWGVLKERVQALLNEPKPQAKPNVLYKVQVGAFKELKNANVTLSSAKANGFNAFIANEDGLYKVQIGAFSNVDNAKNLAEKAKKAGFKVYITNLNETQPKVLKPIATVAKEVIRGDWGNGASRKEALIKAGYNYDEVQREVNRKLY